MKFIIDPIGHPSYAESWNGVLALCIGWFYIIGLRFRMNSVGGDFGLVLLHHEIGFCWGDDNE